MKGKVVLAGGAALLLAAKASVAGYVYNPSDFATQVIEYVQGSGVPSDYLSGQIYNDPTKALGRPTVDTTGDGWSMPVEEHVPVVPVYGPWRASEIVTIGKGGSLTLKFDRPVTNDPNHPFGTDLIVFGNAPIYIDGVDSWNNRDPMLMSAGTLSAPEPATVSVSQDGQTWYAFDAGPFADGFAPTLGRVLDPAHPDPAVGTFNQWWGSPTNPTLPLDPTLSFPALEGKTVEQMAQLYGESAGGTGFDIGKLGLDWIQYVRIDNPAGSNVTPDIDAVAIVAAVPEPNATMVLGLCAIGLIRRKSRR